MNIVGISAFGQNPAACLLQNGKLMAFAEEERFIRIKSAFGRFPLQSLKYCLSAAKISVNDINLISVGWDFNKYQLKMPIFYFKQWLKYGLFKGNDSDSRVIADMITLRPREIERQIYFNLQTLGYLKKLPKIQYISHHKAHAASSFYASGYSDALIVVLDGSGEERATTIYSGNGLDIKELNYFTIPDSLGWLYATTTAYLGFKPYEDDGFVMGLAPYGKENRLIKKKLKKIISYSSGKYSVNPQYTLLGKHSYSQYFSDKFTELLGKHRLSTEPMNTRFKNIAFAVQKNLEETVLSIVQGNINSLEKRNLCLAGGVALNCKMNGEIIKSGLIDDIFVQPASNDAGTALGAAMLASIENNFDPRFSMDHCRWGPEYSAEQIKKSLDGAMFSYKKIRNIEGKVAELIAKGKIVARFEGRMEVGPRALGGRSILANPCIKGMNNKINNKVKHRDPWRPFCPSIIKDSVNLYLENKLEDRFMTIIYEVKKAKINKISSVVHVDGTTRPQSVEKEVDPKYYSLIKKVGEYTDNPVVLNTSFNVKGEPIVCSPNDALRCFSSCGIDAMAIGDFLVQK